LEPRQLLSTVSVSTTTTFQTIKAMGANFAKTARNSGAPISDPIMKYLLDHLHPTQARIPINLDGWEPKPDNSDPNVINWAGFHDAGREHEQFLQLQDLQKRGMTIMASMFDAPDWAVTDPTLRQHRRLNPDKYAFFAEGVGAFLIRARDTYGVKIDVVSVNESNAGFNISMPISIFKDFLHVAGPMFQKMGLGYVKWLVNDDGSVGTGNYYKPAQQDASIAPYIGAWGWHTWNLDNFPDQPFIDMGKVANSFGQELWATETGFDPLLNDHDPAAFSTWDTARQMAKIYLRSLKLMPVTVMDYWQFADDFPLVSPTLQPFPTYFIIKAYDDNLKPGSVIVKASSDDSSVLSIAAKDQANNRFFAQAINTSTGTKTVTFTGLPNQPLTLTRSSATENGITVGTFTPTGGKLTLTLPKDSVNTLSGKFFSGTASPPSASISKPTTSTTYTAGSTISFAGSASDAQDGTLSGSSLKWKVEFHHNGIIDTPMNFSGTSGSFVASSTTQRQTDQFYRITLTATDSSGLSSTKTIDVQPKLTNITLASNVPGLFVRIDGLADVTNTTVSEVAGKHHLDASSFISLNGHFYQFQNWSDGGARTHDVTNSSDVTYTANYVDVTGTGSEGYTLNAIADAYVSDGSPDANFGTSGDLQVKQSTDAGKTRISYLTFDLSSITRSIGTAYLRLFGNYSGTDLVDTNVYGVSNTSWSENGITFNNRPALDSTAISKTKLGDNVNRWYQWDITKYIAAAKAAGKSTISLALNQATAGSTETFNSREAASNTPQVVMSVTGSTTTQPPPPTQNPVTTVLSARQDAFVQDGTGASTNFGANTQLFAKVYKYANYNRRSYIQFDLTSLSSSITSAKLRLNGLLSATSATNLKANLFDVSNQSWSEGGITWNNKPGYTNGTIATVTVKDATARNYDIDLTSYIKSKKAAGATRVTIAITAATSAGPIIMFGSRESSTPPKLTVIS
jgi:hypothetical protein